MTIAMPKWGPQTQSGFSGRLSWALFDWANQPFFTVITTFIFAPYFTAVLIGDPVMGQAYWGYIQALAGAAIAILSPFLGAVADAGGPRKPWIAFFQLFTILGCFMLWWAEPGASILFVMVAILIATVGAEFSILFNNSQLPAIAAPRRIGLWSGIGWGLGYTGGIIALLITLAIAQPEILGIATPEGQTLFGLDRASHEGERFVGPFSALWLMVFVLPMFLLTPDIAPSGLGKRETARVGLRKLFSTLRTMNQYKNPFSFLLAHMLYNDGLTAVIAFGGIYAAGQFNWATAELGVFGILLTIFAMMGAFLGGWLDDRLGSKRTINFALGCVTLATVGIISTGRETILFFIPAAPPVAGDGLFSSLPEQFFMSCAILLGVGMGPMQAASRTMIGRLAPAGMTAEFYGLFALSGKATAFAAPFLIALLTQISGSQAVGASVVLIFLLMGFGLLQRVDAR